MEQDNTVGITMMMVIKWKWDISFVFEAFTVEAGDTGLIIMGMIVTLIVGILSVGLPSMKNTIQNRLFSTKKQSSLLFQQSEAQEEEETRQKSTAEDVFSFFYIFIYSLMHILNMMLIMTYNGYVCIVVIVGMALGYTFFGVEKGKDKTMPVNCCA